MNEKGRSKDLKSKMDLEKIENIHTVFWEKIKANKIENIYNRFLEKIKEISTHPENKSFESIFLNLVDLLIEKISSKDELLLVFTGKTFDDDYIYVHSLNVCLISLRIGLKMNFDKDRLKVLGFLALMHAYKDMGFHDNLLEGFTQEPEMTEIIRLADIYDGLTHPPPYRNSLAPYEAIMSIMNSHTYFNPDTTRFLLKEMSFYPRGSWVKLSTNEIGKVIKVNKGQAMQPTVVIFIDPKGNHLKEKRIVDLSKNNCIYIAQPLSEEDIMNMKIRGNISSSYK